MNEDWYVARGIVNGLKKVSFVLFFQVHRDVKPENIMIFDADFRKVKLIDFGMTRRCGSYVRRLIGSIPYSPPEVCDAHSNDILVSSSMDVWAFGVLLFCSLTGTKAKRVLFHRSSVRKMFSR